MNRQTAEEMTIDINHKPLREFERQGISRNEYVNIHRWLKRFYGRASECRHCQELNTTPKGRFEWALIKGFKYERNIENYMPLCASCHKKYDMDEEKNKRASARMKIHYKRDFPMCAPRLYGADHPGARPLYKIDKETGNILAEYVTIRNAERDNNKRGIGSAIIRNGTCGGFVWKYKEK